MRTRKRSAAITSSPPDNHPAGGKSIKLNYDKKFLSTILEVFAEYESDKILALVVQRIPKLVGAKDASLFWYDRETNRIVLRQTSGVNKKQIGRNAYAIGEGLTGWVAKTGLPLRIENIENASELRSIDPALTWSDKYGGFKYATATERESRRAFLAVPINIEGTTMGILRLAQTLEPNAVFTEEHQELLTTLAEHLSTILKKGELLQKAEGFDSLIEDEDLTLFNSTEGYLRWVVNLIPAILGSSGCTIFLKETGSDSYILKYASKDNPLESQVGRASYDLGEGLTGWVLLKGKSLRINDIENVDELRRIDLKLRWMGKHLEYQRHHSTFLASPIRTKNQVLGVIRLSKESKDMPFTEQDERLLTKYGRFLGSALRSHEFDQDGHMFVNPVYGSWHCVIKPCCYVLMPYAKDWSKNVKRTIKTAVQDSGLTFRTAEEEVGQTVMKDVWKGLCESRIVVADLSDANPNVAYEVGLADVLGKETILIAQNVSAVPFDFAGKRLLAYRLDRLDRLQDELARKIRMIVHRENV